MRILFTSSLVWCGLFSLFIKGLRKTNPKNPTLNPNLPKENEPSSIFDSFLENLMKEEEPAKYEPVVLDPEPEQTEILPPPEEKKVFSYDDLAETSNYLKKTDVYEESASERSSTLNQELKTHLKQSKTKPRFDLRKAVIYSEILNRRYF